MPPGRSGSSSPFYSAAGSLGPAGSLLLGSAASSEIHRLAGLYRYRHMQLLRVQAFW